MARRSLLVGCFALLLVFETGYFARQCVAGLLRLQGEAAFYRNDHPAAWRFYQRGLAWEGDRERLETDMVELLLFGLDQTEAGLKIDTAVPAAEAVRLAHGLTARRIHEAPYRTYYWSLASDVYFYAARQRRRTIPIDISRLSSNPLDTLLEEDWLGIAALTVAATLEPNNTTYHDLLVDTFLSAGSPALAADPCRRAVAALPSLDAHRYLLDTALAPELLEQALLGFDDALARDSMVPRAAIERDTGRFLARHELHARAVPHYQRAIDIAPDYYDALMDMAMSYYQLKDYSSAVSRMEVAEGLRPDDPWAYYYIGMCHLATGATADAIKEFRRARERSEGSEGEVKFFHQLGEALESAGQIKDAERQFVAAANLHARDAEAWHGLLSFYIRQGNFYSATDVCPRLLALAAGDSRYEAECSNARQGIK